MPLLRQLEFVFRSTGILSASRTDSSRGEPTAGTIVLLQTARELLRSLGAAQIANELHVEWNSRLKTAAGRADYRQKLISLNPRLVEHPTEIDRTLRHELAHILAQFRAGRGSRPRPKIVPAPVRAGIGPSPPPWPGSPTAHVAGKKLLISHSIPPG